MTVKELKEKLEGVPDDCEVLSYEPKGCDCSTYISKETFDSSYNEEKRTVTIF